MRFLRTRNLFIRIFFLKVSSQGLETFYQPYLLYIYILLFVSFLGLNVISMVEVRRCFYIQLLSVVGFIVMN